MSILIVDDSFESRLMLITALKKNGFPSDDLIEADSGASALELLGITSENKISKEIKLILMDVMMPGISGIELIKMIKKEKRFVDVPIIMVTANTTDSSLETAFELGAVDYVTKTVQ